MDAGASVIAFVSLSFQLAAGLKKGYEFWKSVEEADTTISAIAQQIKSFCAVLDSLAERERRNPLSDVTKGLLESCTIQIQTILDITEKIEVRIDGSSGGKRKWAAVGAVLKEKKIAKLQAALESTKQTLALALQIESDRHITHSLDTLLRASELNSVKRLEPQITIIPASQSVCLELESVKCEIVRVSARISNPVVRRGFEKGMEMALKEITSGILDQNATKHDNIANNDQDGLPAGEGNICSAQRGTLRRRKIHISKSTTTTTNFFGTIVWSSNSYINRPTTSTADLWYMPDDKGSEIKFRMTPAQWLLRLGVKYEVRFSASNMYGEWKKNLSILTVLPNDSLAFQLCEQGNIGGLRLLFDRHEASPYVANEKGQTLLHVAAKYMHIDICQMLWNVLKESAFQEEFYGEIIQLIGNGMYNTIGYGIGADAPAESRIAILRLFLTSADIHDPFNECWHLLREVVWCNKGSANQCKYEVYTWLLSYLAQELASPATYFNSITFYVLEDAANTSAQSGSISHFKFALDRCGNKVQTVDRPGQFTFLNKAILLHDFEQAALLLRRGADVHTVGNQIDLSPVEETPTSLALYTFEGFGKWWNVLSVHGFDLSEFVRNELAQGPLERIGWGEHTLVRLFEMNKSVKEDGWLQKRIDIHECPRCGECSCSDAHNAMIVDVQWQLLLEKIKRGGEYDDDRSRLGERSCDLPVSQPLGLPITEYGWVCLKCWHRAGCLSRRMAGESDRLDEEPIVEVGEHENEGEDDENSPFLLSF